MTARQLEVQQDRVFALACLAAQTPEGTPKRRRLDAELRDARTELARLEGGR